MNDTIIINEPIQEFFGLTYANYLVLQRCVLQSMPQDWQQKFVELLNEIPETIEEDFEPEGGYQVRALDKDKKFIKDEYADYERGRRRLNTRHNTSKTHENSPGCTK